MFLFIGAVISLPSTIIHAFSGLSTYIFVTIMAGTIIALGKESNWLAILPGAIAMITRPEAWTLTLILPIYYLDSSRAENRLWAARAAIILGSELLIVLGFNYFHFGWALPNTFYAKSAYRFHFLELLKLLVLMAPVITVYYRKGFRMAAFSLTVFVCMALEYSHVDLWMNFANRFGFQIFFPLYVAGAYFLAESDAFTSSALVVDRAAHTIRRRSIAALIIPLLFFVYTSCKLPSLLWAANYYPRALNSLSELGHAFGILRAKNHHFNGLAIGDAGMVPFYSNMHTLDFLGLGSALVAHEGLSVKTISTYSPNAVVLFAGQNGIVRKEPIFNQGTLVQWEKKMKFEFVCSVIWSPPYLSNVYISPKIHIKNRYISCMSAKRNK